MRKIIHIDMDAFFASVEQRDNAALRGKPVAVGHEGPRGVVMAASYEARAFGVHSAMPSVTARRLCPALVFIAPRFEEYKAVSRQIMEIFFEYTDLVEPLSLDEAYLDVTENKRKMPSATLIAGEIKARITEATGLTASAGISINKFLAKTASGLEKPDGLTLIPPGEAEAFLERLGIENFHGIGRVTAEKMRRLGIRTGADLKKRELPELIRLFGKAGTYYHDAVRCGDGSPVVPHRPHKSIGGENTFSVDLTTEDAMLAELLSLAETVHGRLRRADLAGKVVVLKIKYGDFTVRTRRKSFSVPIQSADEIFAAAVSLLARPELPEKPVRLLGVTLAGLERASGIAAGQLTLSF